MLTKTGGTLPLLAIFIALWIDLGECWTCRSSRGTDQKWNNDGVSKECVADARAGPQRYCVKLKLKSRPGKYIRDCDHIYEKLFGYDNFKITGKLDVNGEECGHFVGKVRNGNEVKEEKVTFCACATPECNTDADFSGAGDEPADWAVQEAP